LSEKEKDTLPGVLAYMFSEDKDVEMNTILIAEMLEHLVRECPDAASAIGVAIGCAMGCAILGDEVGELTDLAKHIAKDGHRFVELKEQFYKSMDERVPMPEDPGETVH
tara:strand:+ start:1229 stop:1555 length:327 start_codon:yes stop_codon:yes gene_type:complete